MRARRYGSTFALLMMDLDYLKSINDRLGHVAGDQYLRRVGEVIRETIRGADVPCRYGGEEFCVLLPETEPEGANIMAERIRVAVSQMEVQAGGSTTRATMSVGVACYPSDYPGSTQGLIDRADQALYAAKQAGRNRVMRASDLVATPASQQG